MTSPVELGLTMSGCLSVVGSALLLLGGEACRAKSCCVCGCKLHAPACGFAGVSVL